MRINKTILFSAALLGVTLVSINCSGEGNGGLGASLGSLGRGAATVGGYAGVDSRYTAAAEAGGTMAEGALMGPAEANEFGQTLAVGVTNATPIVSSQALQDYVTNVGLTIASVCPRPELPFAFGVLDTSEVQAFSAPGGYIFISRGALAQMQDESELAGVLAHEIAHIVEDHGLKAMKSQKMGEGGAKAIGAGVNAPYAYEAADAGINKLASSKFSQHDESEADQLAVEYLKKANYDPTGLARFIERLPDASGLFASHPRPAGRVKKINQLANGAAGQTLPDRFKRETTGV